MTALEQYLETRADLRALEEDLPKIEAVCARRTALSSLLETHRHNIDEQRRLIAEAFRAAVIEALGGAIVNQSGSEIKGSHQWPTPA